MLLSYQLIHLKTMKCTLFICITFFSFHSETLLFSKCTHLNYIIDILLMWRYKCTAKNSRRNSTNIIPQKVSILLWRGCWNSLNAKAGHCIFLSLILPPFYPSYLFYRPPTLRRCWYDHRACLNDTSERPVRERS
jgi:hypothetical protein